MKRLLIPENLRLKLADFLRDSSLELELVTTDPADLRVVPAAVEREPSDTETLRVGGAIDCATAWALAEKHGLDLMQLGALLNLLEIRVCKCCLGCFQ